MTIRRTAPVVDNAAVRRAVLVARARAAFDAAHDAEASRTVRTVGADGAVVIATREAPEAPLSPEEAARARVAALRARLSGGAFRPVGR